MISPKYLILLVICCLALVWACKPSETPDKAAAEIIEAFDGDNSDAARSRADAFFKSGVQLDTVAVPRLCMLAVTLAKLSESGEHSEDYMVYAMQCYRTAMKRDSVTTIGFFEAIPADDYKYANYLRQLRRQIYVRETGVTVDESENQESNEQ